jgi:hypothetical protein
MCAELICVCKDKSDICKPAAFVSTCSRANTFCCTTACCLLLYRSYISDITTAQCRQLLKKEAAGSLFDVVLHDGAPNVGGAWSSEAYTQVGARRQHQAAHIHSIAQHSIPQPGSVSAVQWAQLSASLLQWSLLLPLDPE